MYSKYVESMFAPCTAPLPCFGMCFASRSCLSAWITYQLLRASMQSHERIGQSLVFEWPARVCLPAASVNRAAARAGMTSTPPPPTSQRL